MCGISGIVQISKKPIRKDIIEKMVEILHHRGPDDKGFYFSDHVLLGHARLSIIDLSDSANQPMTNEDGSLYVVHNGEIYNYLELRDELVGLGHKFHSKSDTEVILHAYEEWGELAPKRFNGMWAFAIFDIRKNILFCSRDRFGVKPFYYYRDNDIFVFASEIKALFAHPGIKRTPNDQTISTYLSSGYGYMDTSDETFFQGVRQLKPGHSIRLSVANGTFSQKPYWNLLPREGLSRKKDEDIFRDFKDLFESSVKVRLRSDVPLGVMLSGGLDSSSITSVAAKLMNGKAIESFSSCFDEKEYDERPYIKQVLDKTGAIENLIFTKPDHLFDDMKRIIYHQDEPYSTLSIFPQWYVMKCAREKGVKVLLAGQGGDEALGGYNKYYFYLFADLINSFHWIRASREITKYRALKRSSGSISKEVAQILLSYSLPNSIKGILNAHRKIKPPKYLNKEFAERAMPARMNERRFTSILNNDLYNGLRVSPLPSLLHIDDRSSMAHSVESRAPFLDYRIIEFLFSLGPEFKIRDGVTKYILRKSMTGMLPEGVRMRKDKMSFATPLDRWLAKDLYEDVRELFSSREFGLRQCFDQKEVLRIFDAYKNGKREVGHFTIWSWVNLELWFRAFIDKA